MTSQQILTQLKKLGKPNTVAIYTRHGVTGACYGVNYADLKPLAKKVGKAHATALELWKSGIHDARIAATMIVEPQKMTRAEIEAWLSDCNNYVLTDAVAGVAAAMPDAVQIARDWIGRKEEWAASAGWNTIGFLASKRGVPAEDGRALLDRIEKTIHQQPNRTRHAMNGVLIGIGGYVDALRPHALAVAKTIGKVEVDHGETGCVTPDAAGYIAKLAAHRAGKAARPKAKPRATRSA
jgi:3-methyladenine DNA glycosylase AlkD